MDGDGGARGDFRAFPRDEVVIFQSICCNHKKELQIREIALMGCGGLNSGQHGPPLERVLRAP